MGVLPTLRGLMTHDLIERQVLGGGPWLNPLWNRETSSFGGGGSGGATEAYARRAPFYEPFTPAGDDDEFDDESFTGWTTVDGSGGAGTVTVTEGHDVVSLAHAGGDTTWDLHAYLKAMTLSANDYVEAWVEYYARNTSTPSVGVVMADGATAGAGTAVIFGSVNAAAAHSMRLASVPGFVNVGTATDFSLTPGSLGRGIGVRLVYEGANNWSGWVSINGFDWQNVTGTLARVMTPTHAGFFISVWGSAVTPMPMLANVHYCRFSV